MLLILGLLSYCGSALHYASMESILMVDKNTTRIALVVSDGPKDKSSDPEKSPSGSFSGI